MPVFSCFYPQGYRKWCKLFYTNSMFHWYMPLQNSLATLCTCLSAWGWHCPFLLPAERCELSAAVVGGVCGLLWEAHWCAVSGASEVSTLLTHTTHRGALIELSIWIEMLLWRVKFQNSLCYLPSLLFPHLLLCLRLEDCSSDVPLLPREVLMFLSTKLWDSTTHLSVIGEHNGSDPHPLLLIKFFIIVCRWGLHWY